MRIVFVRMGDHAIHHVDVVPAIASNVELTPPNPLDGLTPPLNAQEGHLSIQCKEHAFVFRM